jgi:hypothetical protein
MSCMIAAQRKATEHESQRHACRCTLQPFQQGMARGSCAARGLANLKSQHSRGTHAAQLAAECGHLDVLLAVE